MLIRGRTDTFLHLLAIAQESGVDFTFDDFDRISREIPCRCKVSPSAHWVLAEDMHGTGDAIDVVIEAAERADKDPEYTSLDDAPSWVIVPEHHIDNRRMGGLFAKIKPPSKLQRANPAAASLWSIPSTDRP